MAKTPNHATQKEAGPSKNLPDVCVIVMSSFALLFAVVCAIILAVVLINRGYGNGRPSLILIFYQDHYCFICRSVKGNMHLK